MIRGLYMKKTKIAACAGVSALCLLIAATAFGSHLIGDEHDSSEPATADSSAQTSTQSTKSASETKTEPATESATQHISPVETVSAECATQQTVSKTISRENGSNTLKLPLADFIEEGDKITSFTFVVYSGDGSNIGEFKGGCGISVSEDCPSATDKGWYQSGDFTAPTQGTYGEIKWDVPADIRDCITPAGEVLFGYWWGGAGSVRIEEVVCTYTRTRAIPVDGTVSQQVGKSVSYSSADNTIKIPTAGFLPEGAVPQAVTFNVSAAGSFRKYTGGFGYSSSAGSCMSPDTAFFTDSSSLSLTWFVPEEAKNYIAEDGELVLGYWWSEQPVSEMFGGKVQIHPHAENVIHLMRGEVYEIEGKSFFTFGGAASVDKVYRTEGYSWWSAEEPSLEEIDRALNNLDRIGNKTDYIITHTLPERIIWEAPSFRYKISPCRTAQFLDTVLERVQYDKWFCGHFHIDTVIKERRAFVVYDTVHELSCFDKILN